MEDPLDMMPEVTAALVADPSVPAEVLRPPAARGLFGVPVGNIHTFTGVSWAAWKSLWGCRWDRRGQFRGALTVGYLGDGRYSYTPEEGNPFHFERWNGTRIMPGKMNTDGASVPRILWSVPGMAAVDYLPAALIHDWLFSEHRRGESEWTFDDANLVLAEAIYTMMAFPASPYAAAEDWRVVVAYHAAVSRFGKKAWVG